MSIFPLKFVYVCQDFENMQMLLRYSETKQIRTVICSVSMCGLIEVHLN